jgi:hypothetical protein
MSDGPASRRAALPPHCETVFSPAKCRETWLANLDQGNLDQIDDEAALHGG